MNTSMKFGLFSGLTTAASGAFAGPPGGGVVWALAYTGGGFIAGFLLGLWWCKRSHKHGERGERSKDL